MGTGNPSGNVTRLKNSYSVAKITQSGQTGASYAVAAAYFEHVRHPIRNGITAHARNQRGGTTPLLLLLDSYRWILGGETPVRRRTAIGCDLGEPGHPAPETCERRNAESPE
jgi:hypothetical protein